MICFSINWSASNPNLSFSVIFTGPVLSNIKGSIRKRLKVFFLVAILFQESCSFQISQPWRKKTHLIGNIALFSKLNEFSSFVDDELVEAELGQTLLFFNFLSCFLIKILQLEIGNILNCAQDDGNHSNWQPFISQAKHFFSQREGKVGAELCQAQSS